MFWKYVNSFTSTVNRQHAHIFILLNEGLQ